MATKISLSVKLSRQISAVLAEPAQDKALALLAEIQGLVKKAEETKKVPKDPGLSIHQIINAVGRGFNGDLILPPKLTPPWVARQVYRVKELGLDEHLLEQLGMAARRRFGKCDLEYVLRIAVGLLSTSTTGLGVRGPSSPDRGAEEGHLSPSRADFPPSRIHTGREEL